MGNAKTEGLCLCSDAAEKRTVVSGFGIAAYLILLNQLRARIVHHPHDLVELAAAPQHHDLSFCEYALRHLRHRIGSTSAPAPS